MLEGKHWLGEKEMSFGHRKVDGALITKNYRKWHACLRKPDANIQGSLGEFKSLCKPLSVARVDISTFEFALSVRIRFNSFKSQY